MMRMPTRPWRALATLVAASTLAACSSMPSWMPTIPVPSFAWLTGGGKKPGPLPEVSASAIATANWQVAVGKSAPGLVPAITADGVYAAAADGTLVRIDAATGRVVWRTSAGTRIAAGVGAGPNTVVVGTDKGEVLAFDGDGKPKWTARVSSEVLAPPVVADGVVAVNSGDGRIYGFGAEDGKTRWVYSRANPPLTVRNVAGGVTTRGGLFVGVPGGRLLAIDIVNGNLGWDGTVAIPRGATELERIADVTSRPVVDERQACAAAYQGRVVCFDVLRGTINWSRDIASLAGVAMDERYVYLTDEKGAVHALDKSTGASVWKQDRLAERRLGGPQSVGEFVGIVDVEGYLHLLSKTNGAYVGRLATDGSTATGQPMPLLSGALWQSINGTVYLVSAK